MSRWCAVLHACIRASRVETIDLVLKRGIDLGVRQEAMEYADECTRYGLHRVPIAILLSLRRWKIGGASSGRSSLFCRCRTMNRWHETGQMHSHQVVEQVAA